MVEIGNRSRFGCSSWCARGDGVAWWFLVYTTFLPAATQSKRENRLMILQGVDPSTVIFGVHSAGLVYISVPFCSKSLYHRVCITRENVAEADGRGYALHLEIRRAYDTRSRCSGPKPLVTANATRTQEFGCTQQHKGYEGGC